MPKAGPLSKVAITFHFRGRVLNYIWSPDDIPYGILQAPGKLADKYCRIIKDKFAGFNKEIEDISSTQRSYSIPDVGLR